MQESDSAEAKHPDENFPKASLYSFSLVRSIRPVLQEKTFACQRIVYVNLCGPNLWKADKKRDGCISTSVVIKLSSPPKSTLGFTAASLIDKYWTNHNHQTVMRLGERNCLLCWLKQKWVFQIYRLYKDINSYLNLPLERLNMINDLIQHQCCS